MNGPVFDAIFIIGLAAAITTITLIGLTLVLCARDSWRSRRQHTAMERLRVGDRERSDEEIRGRRAGEVVSRRRARQTRKWLRS